MQIFDVGMFDGSDTAYYLAHGAKVVAVEANPTTAAQGQVRFSEAIARGQLTIEPVAIGAAHGEITLHICPELGSCSVVASYALQHGATDTVTVPTVPLRALFERHGVPDFLKVDIEGADHLAINALTKATAPPFVSFELGLDGLDLIQHLADIGYTGFKVISQVTFREIANVDPWTDRLTRRWNHLRGRQITEVRRAGRSFRVEHSAGPMPSESDGQWRTHVSVVAACYELAAGPIRGWYDCHACR